jgi:ubiquinone/menaquinone biosynthesis C-methylase UbiE
LGLHLQVDAGVLFQRKPLARIVREGVEVAGRRGSVGCVGVRFNEETSKRLERMYGTADMVLRRERVRAALVAAPGERILDVGCGPGFYVAELLEEVGPAGSVVGVDGSPDMLALAQARCDGRTNAEFLQGDATAPPVEAGSFDAVVCVQVLEYVADATVALTAMCNALRSGGRVVVWDTDWATVSWHSSDPARTQRILCAFDEHLAHPSLPQTMASRLRAAGFDDVGVVGYSVTSTELTPDTTAGALLPLIADFVPGHQGVTKDEAVAWADDQRDLHERSEFFFSCSQFCFTGTKRVT